MAIMQRRETLYNPNYQQDRTAYQAIRNADRRRIALATEDPIPDLQALNINVTPSISTMTERQLCDHLHTLNLQHKTGHIPTQEFHAMRREAKSALKKLEGGEL